MMSRWKPFVVGVVLMFVIGAYVVAGRDCNERWPEAVPLMNGGL